MSVFYHYVSTNSKIQLTPLDIKANTSVQLHEGLILLNHDKLDKKINKSTCNIQFSIQLFYQLFLFK